jgi:hypothetical protein
MVRVELNDQIERKGEIFGSGTKNFSEVSATSGAYLQLV